MPSAHARTYYLARPLAEIPWTLSLGGRIFRSLGGIRRDMEA